MILETLNSSISFGSKTLCNITRHVYDTSDPETAEKMLLLAVQFIRLQPREAMWAHLCCYGGKNIALNDAFWAVHISAMIQAGTLYFALIPLANCAYSDKQRSKNISNVSEYLEVVEDTYGTTDGIVRVKKSITLVKVDINISDDEIGDIKEEDKCLIEPMSIGVIEFGTQDICKTAINLKMGVILFTVPYELPPFLKANFGGPYMGVFLNKDENIINYFNTSAFTDKFPHITDLL